MTVVSFTNASVRTIETNSSGVFTVASLAAGTHQVTVGTEGFPEIPYGRIRADI
ncbi:hypothetical protein SBA3_1820036 [Candidatus Sulfopaludibacter sp. SbA3]|nr:hypothetical protein SBA3_1820036 [Candidatus Sulfopaludibacter sp. SbA3]